MVAMAACGSSPATVSAGDYARGVCGAIGDWGAATQVQAEALGAAFLNVDATVAKAGLVAVLEGVLAETSRLNERIAESGVPNVEDGSGLAREITDAFADIEVAVDRARAEALALPAAGMPELIAGATALMNLYQSRVSDSLGLLDDLERKYPSRVLHEAIGQEPSCAVLAA